VATPVILGSVAFYDYLDAVGHGDVTPDFGVPLVRQQELISAAARSANGGPIYLGAHDSFVPSLGYLTGEALRTFDDQIGLPLPPSDRPSVLLMNDPSTRGSRLAREWLRNTTIERMVLADTSAVTLYTAAPGATDLPADFNQVGAKFDNGMILVGHQVGPNVAAKQLVVELLWRFGGTVPTNSPTAFNHLIDAQGNTTSLADGLIFNGHDWHPGEGFVSTFVLPLPATPGEYRLQVGMYDYPSMSRFVAVLPSGGPPVDALDLGRISLSN
jgi:hypothetical protein